MATAAQVEAFRTTQDEVTRYLTRDIRRLWTGLRRATPETLRDTLLQIGPTLSDQYGALAASEAADWFEMVTGRPAILGAGVPHEQVVESIRWGVGPAFDGLGEEALSRISKSLAKHSLQPGRNTVATSSRRRGLRYGRAPEPGACSWCIILSSRGAVYDSEAAAGGGPNSYHEECRCTPEPVPPGAELSYDTGPLYDRYQEARRAAIDDGHGASDKAIAAKMRELYGLP